MLGGVKCVECGLETGYLEIKWAPLSMGINHKPDCTQRGESYPKVQQIISKPENPSIGQTHA